MFKTYPLEVSAVHISSNIWNYIQSLGIHEHRTLVQSVKEQLEEHVTQVMRGMFTISFSRSTYVSVIRTPTGQHVIADNEVEVQDTKDIYLQTLFATTNFYGTGKQRFETVIFQAGKKCKKETNYNNIWFGKSFGCLSVNNTNRCCEKKYTYVWRTTRTTVTFVAFNGTINSFLCSNMIL